jgi:FdhD protein
MLPLSHVSARVLSVNAEGPAFTFVDEIAVEEPLEIRVGHLTPTGYQTNSISITMRTPGADRELAAGFLLTEGIVNSGNDIVSVTESAKPGANMVRADLAPGVVFDPETQSRHFYTSSSCGICGKASLEAIAVRGLRPIPRETMSLTANMVHLLPAQLRQAQSTFQVTGGLHACALFDETSNLLDVQEDVGRHNALDKLIGRAFLADRLPLHLNTVLVSGRASFELVQKCVAAGVSILAAVGAPSSLAVDLAREWDLTLLGFVRNNRFNIYSGEWRIVHEAQNAEKLTPAAADSE